MQKKMIAHFVADSHEEFRKVCEELRGTGFTHVVVSDVPRSLWMWEMDRKNPYVNWSMGQCQIFKLVCPPELEAYLPQDHIRMCMDFVKTRCTIAAENGLKPALISNEPFWLPEQVFRDHPSWRGARCDHPRRSRHPFFSPSLDNPEVLSMYRAATRRLVEETGIDFLHFRTNDCGGGVDWSTGLYTGPNGQAAGEGRNMADRVIGFLDAVQGGNAEVTVSLETDIALKEPEWLIGAAWPGLHENQILNKKDREGHVVLRNTFNLAFGRQPVRKLPAPMTLLENLMNMPAAMPVQIIEIPRSDLEEGIDLWRMAEGKTIRSEADCYALLAKEAEQLAGDQAPDLVQAWHLLHESSKHLAHTGVNLVIQGVLHQRWINRPFVLRPKELTDDEKAWWRPFQFQAQTEREADDLMNLQGIEVIRGFTASFLAVQSLQMGRNALRGAIARFRKLKPSEALSSTIRRLEVQDALLTCAQNAIRFQELRDRTDTSGETEPVRALRWPTKNDPRAAEFQQITRAEIDNSYRLAELLDGHMEEIMLCTSPENEDIFVLSTDLPSQLRRKAEIMLDHFNDSARFYETNNV